jgi:Ni/Co efflux regulator RcnB
MHPKNSPGGNTMKKLFTTVALVALVATPVLAQTNDRTQQRARVEASQTQTKQPQQQRRAATRTHDVYDIRGQYVGSDPDPAIRAQLANDPTQAGD